MATLCPNCGIEIPSGANFCPRCTTADPKPVKDAMCGRIVGGRYRIVRKLGQGGMGVVYEAEHVEVGQKVAIKFLHPTFSGDQEVVRRFHNEARSYAQIIHPHAVQLHDFGKDDDGNLYISMEYLEGCDLKKTLAREERLSTSDALDVVQQVADVLGTAHARGIIHRDLKPENIMLSRELRGYFVKVLDFGLARLAEAATGGNTAPGMVCGTPRYMAPEQSEGLPIDHRVDIYALGLVLFESLTGTHPFEAPSISETLRLQRTAPVPHLWDAVPGMNLERVDRAIQTATAKAPAARFATMLDFVRAFSDNVTLPTGASAPTAEDVAATSAKIPASRDAVEPVGATLPSAPRREAARPSPPVAIPGTAGSAPQIAGPIVSRPAAPAAEAAAVAPVPLEVVAAAPKKGLPAALIAVAAVVVVGASVGATLVVRSNGFAAAERRRKIDAFYAAQREPMPPAECREADARRQDKIVAALPHLGDKLADEAKSAEATAALATLEGTAGGSAESAYLLAKAQVQVGAAADDALAAATACKGFAAAENLAGRAAFKAGRKEEAERRFRAAMVPGFPKPRLNLALTKVGTDNPEAFALLAEAVAIQPDYAEAHYALGFLHEAESTSARAKGNEALAEAEEAQSQSELCKAADLGFERAKKSCRR